MSERAGPGVDAEVFAPCSLPFGSSRRSLTQLPVGNILSGRLQRDFKWQLAEIGSRSTLS